MLPKTARLGDFVEVVDRSSDYFGMIGKIKKFSGDVVSVEIYDKSISVHRDNLRLRARKGSGVYSLLTEQINSQRTDNLDEEGYNGLIDFAIGIEDWEWAQSLVKRKNEYISKKRGVR